jgi:hypothetical protein
MWLTFAPPGRELDTSVRPGRVYPCEVRFYPGSGQLRALLEPPLPDPDLPLDASQTVEVALLDRAWGGDDLAGARARLAELLAADPWSSRVPVVLAGVPLSPTAPGEPWLLRDAAAAAVPLVELDGDPWPLVAQSGGEPLQVMGEYDGRRLLPLAVLPDDRGRRYSMVLTG